MKITSKHMDSNPTDADQWFVESGQRGEGTFLGRITPSGNKLFYFRYTGPDRAQVRLSIGFYAKPGSSGGLTVASARAVALEWATLYKSGIRDLRTHFADVDPAKLAACETAARPPAAPAQKAPLEPPRPLPVTQASVRRPSQDLPPRIGGPPAHGEVQVLAFDPGRRLAHLPQVQHDARTITDLDQTDAAQVAFVDCL